MHHIHHRRLLTSQARRLLSISARCLEKPDAGHIAPLASAKLFADATAEGSGTTTSGLSPSGLKTIQAATQEPNWDGDERMEDAVLRMLVDKYKPLRTGVIRSADEKLKAESLLPGEAKSAINRGISLDELPPLQVPRTLDSGRRVLARSSESMGPDDSKARAESRRARKLEEGPRRLGSAKERSLDYRFEKILGDSTTNNERTASSMPDDVADDAVTVSVRRPNPLSVKGWTQLAEERIEKARAAGAFNKIEGRGKPFRIEAEGTNPFIAREERLMNRIIKRQGAAPPWVEIHGELERHIRVFRNVLSSSWIKRATREILLSLPSSSRTRTLPEHITVERVASMRDSEWEERESSYQNAALEEVNSQIRRMNGMAPFAARRGYLLLKYELDRCYEASAPEIVKAIEERLRDDGAYAGRWNGVNAGELVGTAQDERGTSLGFWAAMKRLLLKLMPGPARSTHIVDLPTSHSDSSRGKRLEG
ncbi:hypothetical protein FRB95_003534 [Tulasnella sp. JGI-2019a]|nr:hypothetical protein FRB95_003534 [Tulasnella sp. JGI-2019a]